MPAPGWRRKRRRGEMLTCVLGRDRHHTLSYHIALELSEGSSWSSLTLCPGASPGQRVDRDGMGADNSITGTTQQRHVNTTNADALGAAWVSAPLDRLHISAHAGVAIDQPATDGETVWEVCPVGTVLPAHSSIFESASVGANRQPVKLLWHFRVSPHVGSNKPRGRHRQTPV